MEDDKQDTNGDQQGATLQRKVAAEKFRPSKPSTNDDREPSVNLSRAFENS
ncbi:MAG: hypothetical protein IT314_13095 [Anaerolineales bacterium]|nr:hypothetical protein [Anaerolineales bacterium]